MKKTTIAVLASAVAGVTLLGGVTAYAGVFERGGEKKAYRLISMRVDNMLDDVNATDAQRTQIDDVKDQLFNEAKALMVGTEGAKQEFKAQWTAQTMDKVRVHELVDQRMDVARELVHKLADGVISIHDILTPDQRIELAKLHEERAGERR
jgi:periplasmic protein CpxP/Spy